MHRLGAQALNCWLLIFEQYATFALSKPGDWANKIMQGKQVVRENQRVLETPLPQKKKKWVLDKEEQDEDPYATIMSLVPFPLK